MRYSVVFLAVLSVVLSCATPNPTESSSRGGKETVTDNDTDTLIVDGDSTFGDLYFEFDVKELLEGLGDSSGFGLKKKLTNRTSLLLYKVGKLSDIQFVFTNPVGTSVKSSYQIDSTGKCQVGVIRITRDIYYVAVGFSGTTICPWYPKDSSYSISSEYFFALDTVNLKKKSKDTLKLVLCETGRAKYFVSVKDPLGKYTDGKKYLIAGSEVKALYSGSELKHQISCRNNDTVAKFTITDDTGKVSFSFPFAIDSVFNDDIIECSVKTDTGGVYVGDIVFEYRVALKATKMEFKDGEMLIYFNRLGKMSVSAGSSLRVCLGDTTNLVKKGEVAGGFEGGYIKWTPEKTLKAGSYSIEAKGFVDEYGNESPIFKILMMIG